MELGYTAFHVRISNCLSQGTEKREMGSGEQMIAQHLLHLIYLLSWGFPGRLAVAVIGGKQMGTLRVGGTEASSSVSPPSIPSTGVSCTDFSSLT